jgi:hypothetical protein
MTTDHAELSEELNRLITQGHQDQSVKIAVARKFPGVTLEEIEAGLEEIADNRLKAKRPQ